MNFKSWLLESVIEHNMPRSKFDDPRNRLSWLSVDGSFFPVTGDHGDYAEKHGVEFGANDLLALGWLRVVGLSGSTLYVGNDAGFVPKPKQVSALRDFAISTGRLKRIIFDNGRSKTGKVLWQEE